MKETLAKLFDRFKKDNPKVAVILAFIIGVALFSLEYFVHEGYFTGSEWVPRVLQVLGFLWASVNGSRTYRYLNKPVVLEDKKSPQLISDNGDLPIALQSSEYDIYGVLEYVDPDARGMYSMKLAGALNTMNVAAMSDYSIDALEQVSFDPSHVSMSNKNWVIDDFGTPEDYAKFEVDRNKNVKFFVGVFDDGVPTHRDLSSTNIGGEDFTGEGLSPNHRASHSTSVGSCISSTNPNVTPLYKLAQNKNIETFYFKVLNDSGSGSFSDIGPAIDRYLEIAEKKKEDGYWCFANFSLGADIQTPTSLEPYFKKLEDAGVIVNAATGNSGLNRIAAPSNSTHVDGISAYDVNNKIARFSNRGSGTYMSDGGVMIYVCTPGNRLSFVNGTSFSSPLALKNYFAAISLYNFEDVASLKNYVRSVAGDLGNTGYDTTFGHGRGLLTKMLNTPYENKYVQDDFDFVPVNNTSFRYIDGWETVVKKDNGNIYPLFFEEIEFNVSSQYDAEKLEDLLRVHTNAFFDDYSFKTGDRKDYIFAGIVICRMLEMYLESNNILASVNEAVIDNNNDSLTTVTLNTHQIKRYRGKGVFFEDETLFIGKHRKKEILLERVKLF